MFGYSTCDHTFHLDSKEEYVQYLILKFICNKCGHPKTRVVERGTVKGFDFEVS